MRRRDQYPGTLSAFALAQTAVDFRRCRGVGTPFASILHEVLSDPSANCSVIDAVRAQLFVDLRESRIERADAFHIARIADVHGGGQRRNTGARAPVAGL